MGHPEIEQVAAKAMVSVDRSGGRRGSLRGVGPMTPIDELDPER